MDRMIYLTMSGAKAMMDRQDVLANNLANVSTVGFRAELQAFRSVPLQGSGASTRVFSLETTPGYDATSGPVHATGNPLDVAMAGNAWLAVQGLDGTEAYTRNGQMTLRADGTLANHFGQTVLGEGGPIQVPPNAEVNIAADGTVVATTPGTPPQTIGRLKMVTPDAPLVRGSDGLFRGAGGQPLDADAEARLHPGALEGSNVSPVGAMVSLIATSRQYESQMKLLQTAEGDEKSAAQLLSLS
ncbi:flagellar basal-body rod protein FlgF [Piscinibacter sakaiensis]|uniref:Flagellar basal-body rod protein FlgF n=1 Tax=Piscinibacter sakaiensis TaxID=1547922 RepID=A0A0K8NU19_PISS1|nr:flagellar basal-body rod protein FlgF [Piscinibacter sakaiensis]GAP33754.1 flagellar basal-body rod protein FlgF [Piscinibacter sakaiensis]